jgi:prevent-host-death family protein
MTRSVGAYEAKTHLSALLAEVERGEEVEITKHGRVVARLVPAVPAKRSRAEILDDLADLRSSIKPVGIPFRELIDDGRRY